MAAASSHTGAIASEDHVLDAFFRQHGILRVPDLRSLVLASRLYLQNWSPAGTRVAAISNSGACCVMAADAAARHGLRMQTLPEEVQAELRTVLPAFASTMNPIDLTAALLSDSALFSRVLPIVAKHKAADLFFISLPMSGKGYDVPRFARDARQFAQVTAAPVVVASPLASTRAEFAQQGVLCFEHDEDAMAALAQFARHQALRKTAAALPQSSPPMPALPLPPASGRFLSEADSLDLLTQTGLPCAPYRRCRSREDAEAAASELGGKLVVKACSASIPHKSEYGLVLLGIAGAEAAGNAFGEILKRADQAQLQVEEVVVARMVASRRELIVGARHDPAYGTVVMIGDGGKYVEAMPDVVTLVMPFDVEYAVQRMQDLRIAPLFAGVRGEAPMPLAAIARAALALGTLVQAAAGKIASVDVNPLMVGDDGVLAVDALVELRDPA
jgi:acyl-CoA synthetase (NDP forming)